MSVRLEKLNFKTFYKNRTEMWKLLDSNRKRIAPWFWWANKSVTPNKLGLYIFMILYITDTKRKKIIYKLNPTKTYDVQFFVYNTQGQIGGMCGLDNINIQTKDAENWGLAFKGYTETMDAIKLLEDYCIDVLHLTSVYGRVQSTNRASKIFWEKYGYDKRTLEKNAPVSKGNPDIADIFIYRKYLTPRTI